MSEALIIRMRRRLPRPDGPPGDGAAAARQLEVALSSVGFALSGDLLAALVALQPEAVRETGLRLLDTVRVMVGDHVQHNVYFKDFPENVPDTVDFWLACIHAALSDPDRRDRILVQLEIGTVDLLDLPRYGRYQHSFAEMVAAHDDLVAQASDRLTTIGLGDDLHVEEWSLYRSLAASEVPLAPDDLGALAELARVCVEGHAPTVVPMRDSRAVVNRARADRGEAVVVDTVTDVLRLACALSDGDVSLQVPTRFRAFRRAERRVLLAVLDGIVRADAGKLGDVGALRERWKRLGERLHPHEHVERFPHAAQVFAVARGETEVPSLAARLERGYARGDLVGVLALYRSAPGMLLRALDRLMRFAVDVDGGTDLVVAAVETSVGAVSGRVVLSVREHLENRRSATTTRRIFVNRAGRAWATPDRRPPLDAEVLARVIAVVDVDIARRLRPIDHLVVQHDVLDVALPLSTRATPAGGVGLLPRGSVSRVTGNRLRFFVYWRETAATTDFDLSALVLDRDFRNPTWLSYTNLSTVGGVHSGDITEAPDGASEFIDLDLDRVTGDIVIAQVNVYSGEGFDEVAESFFGYMDRRSEQRGRPFEPATVRMKSDLRGPSRVALPIAFVREDATTWKAVWLHLFLRGTPSFNRVEANRVSTAELARATMAREYLTVGYLLQLLQPSALTVLREGDSRPDAPHVYLGPESLRELVALIPD